jgi:F-type H+-transporting ATPase subunit a
MHESHGFSWLSLIPGLDHVSHQVPMTIFVGIILIGTCLIARLQLNRALNTSDAGLVPESKLTYRNFFEICAEGIYKLTENVIGHHDAPIFYPLIGSLFFFIFFSNLIGLIPGFRPPTDNYNTTFALGFFVFVYYNYAGFRANGIAYLKHFMGPVLFLAPLMIIIEIISHLFRPLSLGLRLQGNINGDHIVMAAFSDLNAFPVPIIFFGFGIFVSFIQAFVFCLMTMVYISLSTAHDH